MTDTDRDPATRTALRALHDWVPTDTLLHRLEHRLRAEGATGDDIRDRIITELGVSATDWHGYHALRHAADRYQQPRTINTPDEGTSMS